MTPGAPADKLPTDIATVKPAQATEVRPPDGRYITVDTPQKLAELVAQLKESPALAVDVETDSTDEVQANLVGIAITATAGEGYYVPVGHGQKAPAKAEGQAALFELTPAEETAGSGNGPAQLGLARVQALLLSHGDSAYSLTDEEVERLTAG